jgi:hypothetical protein
MIGQRLFDQGGNDGLENDACMVCPSDLFSSLLVMKCHFLELIMINCVWSERRLGQLSSDGDGLIYTHTHTHKSNQRVVQSGLLRCANKAALLLSHSLLFFPNRKKRYVTPYFTEQVVEQVESHQLAAELYMKKRNKKLLYNVDSARRQCWNKR